MSGSASLQSNTKVFVGSRMLAQKRAGRHGGRKLHGELMLESRRFQQASAPVGITLLLLAL